LHSNFPLKPAILEQARFDEMWPGSAAREGCSKTDSDTIEKEIDDVFPEFKIEWYAFYPVRYDADLFAARVATCASFCGRDAG
jgi:hypothetical protein